MLGDEGTSRLQARAMVCASSAITRAAPECFLLGAVAKRSLTRGVRAVHASPFVPGCLPMMIAVVIQRDSMIPAADASLWGVL